MIATSRFYLQLKPFVPFVSPARYIRTCLFSTRLCSATYSAEFRTSPQTGSVSNDFSVNTLSPQSYDVNLQKFARRIGYQPEELPSLLIAFTTKSFADLFPSPETNFQYNGRLSLLGRSVILMFIQEHLFTTYPDLPGDALSDVSSVLTNLDAMRTLCECLDLVNVIRTPVKISTDNPSQGVLDILSDVVLAIVSALYCDQGGNAVRKFVSEFIVSELDQGNVEEMAKLEHPKQMLCYILKNQGKPLPVLRLLQKIDKDEDGLKKCNPIFVVGVYSMHRLLAEGTATSLVRAEKEAVKAALLERFAKDLRKAPLPSCQENYSSEEKIKLFEADSTTLT